MTLGEIALRAQQLADEIRMASEVGPTIKQLDMLIDKSKEQHLALLRYALRAI